VPRLHGFTKKDILNVFEKMVLARKLDEKMITLLKQGKSFFHMGSSGHEAAQLAAAYAMHSGKDWVFPYYRDAALCIALGMTSRDHLLSFLARADDPSSGGRQMPHHYGYKNLRIVSQSSSTGTQFLQALGCALACKKEKAKEIVYVSAGEGTTSQGDYHEALNWASLAKAPVVFHIQDNEYAISTHKSEQSSNSVYAMASGYKNLARFEVDGTDFFETNLAFKQAVERGRRGKGPSLVVSNVVRLMSHSSSDDQRKYRSITSLNKDKNRDPISILKNQCLKENFISLNELNEIETNVDKQVNLDSDWAEAKDHPEANTALDYIYDNKIYNYETNFNSISDKIVMVDAINHALNEEMQRNNKMVIYGQDVSDPKGGVFTATKGLSDEFGKDRVFNSPLAESSIIGTAIGMAVAGYKPVVEIQFGDYIWTAMMQLRNEVATMRYRSNNNWYCPMVIRVTVGGYIHGGLCHSQSIDGYFMHMPGIYLVYPSNAADAKGLLKMACQMNDPVLFMEHKGLYRQGFCMTEEPGKDYFLPFGKANVITQGSDVSIITWGAMVQKSLDAINSEQLPEGIAEIIDLRTLNPLDINTIMESIRKTGKVLIVYEDNMTNGPGAEISAIISERFFDLLDGPVRRVAAKDCHIPFNNILEEEVLPQTSDITEALIDLMEY
tara:strand:- start:5268 stop:7271 length:2004 start_codon:yes stop_codon:yes gene_type:complete